MSFSRLGTAIIEDPIHEQRICLVSHLLDPSQHIEYLGQKLVSNFLQRHMGSFYDPISHWTSALRARAGLPSFTMSDLLASTAVTDLMARLAASEGDMDSTFVWTWWQLKRIQKFRFRKTLRDHFDVAVLIRASNVFEDPQFCFIVDPWRLVVSDRLRLMENSKFLATIEDIATVASFKDIGKLRYGLQHNETEDAGLVTLPYHQAPWACRQAVKGRNHDSKSTENLDLVVSKQSDHIASSSSMSSKVYLPFSHRRIADHHIRLFMLFPGEICSPLTGMIFECSSIERGGPYRTLSYEWGPNNAAAQHRLWTADGFLSLHDSLNTALRRLRHETSPTVLWVDAICINQEDEDEKARQILMLPKIFQNATRTMAFLGASTQSDGAIKTLLQITAKEACDSASGNNWPEGLPPVPLSWAARSTPQLDDPIWPCIARFSESAWFRRVWMVQEVVISPRISIVCGNWTANWNDIYRAMDLVEEEQGSSLGAWSSSWQPFMTLSYLRVHEAHRQRYTLLTLLDTFRHVDSTLRRDRYFALIGLACGGNEEAFKPDYRKSIMFEEIACRFGCDFVNDGKGMDLLYRAGLGPNSDRFPSWLPDLTVPGTSTLHDREVNYRASGNLEGWSGWLEGNVLAIYGCHVDEIVSISKHSNSKKAKERAQYFKDVDSMVDYLSCFYAPERLEELKWQVPVADALRPTTVALVDLSMHDSYKAFREILRKAEFKRSKAHDSLLSGSISDWRFVTTKQNHCGIVPGTAQVGDHVSILSGGNIPFLLRKRRKKPWDFIGFEKR
ncbi:heterokaryon incompatibility protein-domain-containing protein [Daldinia grandis]|nr:heterokaryon incompatibility protein-domain-containing protein [Daldinia grandis]